MDSGGVGGRVGGLRGGQAAAQRVAPLMPATPRLVAQHPRACVTAVKGAASQHAAQLPPPCLRRHPRTCSCVVLPAPLTPTSPTRSPFFTSQLTSCGQQGRRRRGRSKKLQNLVLPAPVHHHAARQYDGRAVQCSSSFGPCCSRPATGSWGLHTFPHPAPAPPPTLSTVSFLKVMAICGGGQGCRVGLTRQPRTGALPPLQPLHDRLPPGQQQQHLHNPPPAHVLQLDAAAHARSPGAAPGVAGSRRRCRRLGRRRTRHHTAAALTSRLLQRCMLLVPHWKQVVWQPAGQGRGTDWGRARAAAAGSGGRRRRLRPAATGRLHHGVRRRASLRTWCSEQESPGRQEPHGWRHGWWRRGSEP